MNHRQRTTLHALFAHPVSSNIDPRVAYSVIEKLGGEVTHGGHGQTVIKLNGHTHGFPPPHHAFSKDEVSALKKFLVAAGVDPERDFPLEAGAA